MDKKLASAAFAGVAIGLLAYLDTVLVTIKEQFATSAKADERTKEFCVLFIVLEDDLHELAQKSVTTVDDALVTEFGEAARRILPPELVAELAKLPT